MKRGQRLLHDILLLLLLLLLLFYLVIKPDASTSYDIQTKSQHNTNVDYTSPRHCALLSPPSSRQAMRPIINLPEEDRATDIGIMHKNLAKIARAYGFGNILADRRTDTQTDILITNSQ